MADLKIILFEDPGTLYWVLAVAEVVACVVLYYRRSRGALIGAAVPLLLAVVLAVLAASVTTERERLRTALDALVGAVRDGDAAAADAWVDESYDDGVFRKSTLARGAAAAATAIKVRAIRLFDVQIETDSPEATVTLRAMVHVPDSSLGRDVIPTRWRLWWIRRSEGWRLRSSHLTEPVISGAPRGR